MGRSHGTKGRPEIALQFHNWTDDRDQTQYVYEFWFATEANRELFKYVAIMAVRHALMWRASDSQEIAVQVHAALRWF